MKVLPHLFIGDSIMAERVEELHHYSRLEGILKSHINSVGKTVRSTGRCHESDEGIL